MVLLVLLIFVGAAKKLKSFVRLPPVVVKRCALDTKNPPEPLSPLGSEACGVRVSGREGPKRDREGRPGKLQRTLWCFPSGFKGNRVHCWKDVIFVFRNPSAWRKRGGKTGGKKERVLVPGRRAPRISLPQFLHLILFGKAIVSGAFCQGMLGL